VCVCVLPCVGCYGECFKLQFTNLQILALKTLFHGYHLLVPCPVCSFMLFRTTVNLYDWAFCRFLTRQPVHYSFPHEFHITVTHDIFHTILPCYCTIHFSYFLRNALGIISARFSVFRAILNQCLQIWNITLQY
jgi:hypothetical protein